MSLPYTKDEKREVAEVVKEISRDLTMSISFYYKTTGNLKKAIQHALKNQCIMHED